MTRYLRLFALQFRISAASAMAYRANFLIEGAMSVMWMALTLLPLIVVFDRAQGEIAGWDRASALIVMAYFMGIHAVLEGIITPSLVDLVEKIRSGSFDYVLLKPVDAQAMISASRYEPWKVFDLLGALALVVYALAQRGHAPPLPQLAVGVALFGSGVLAAYALWMLCAAASFWVVRLDNLMYLLGSIFDIARWPVQMFPRVWRLVFTFIIPVAVMTTFPAMALLGTLHAARTLATLGGALVLLIASRLVWRTAIRSYTSASS
ncbi:MAG: ABC transporter permease [Deltaproteobacteria bacterium]|nr:MAG: ABC transporter permease [Deltaproteobacteria bacterium]